MKLRSVVRSIDNGSGVHSRFLQVGTDHLCFDEGRKMPHQKHFLNVSLGPLIKFNTISMEP